MPIYRDEEEYAQFRMMQSVVSMFDGNLRMQRIMHYGFLGMDYEEPELVDDYDEWDDRRNKYPVYPKSSTRQSYTDLNYASALEHPYSSAAKVQAKESDAERKARLLQESKKSKEKAEKKRLKKQRQKERKRLEKKDTNPIHDKEDKDMTSQTKVEDKLEKKDVKEEASAPDSESGGDGSSESSDEENESEGLDLTSTFVTKAAQIAKRQLKQKTKQEKREKKKSPVKEDPKTTPEKVDNEKESIEKKDTTTCRNSKLEDNAKISTELAMIGNKLASAGEFSMAVKYFTDAIRYNPTEYRLFGNRAFCFEKMQEYEKSLNDAALSLSMFPGWVKGLFRKGRALTGLKRYEEAASAFKEVLKLDSSCAEAAQELMRVQIMQLMEYGFTREQSSNALIIHGTVNKALEVLSKLDKKPEMARNGLVPLQQLANVTGVSPVLSAKINPAAAHPPQDPETSKTLPEKKTLLPVPSQTKPVPSLASAAQNVAHAPELFPVWVGSLSSSVTETLITNLFNKVGTVYNVKHLYYKRCAFVNFTQQQHCDDAIRQYNGFELMGSKLVVRYPDRIPHGMNISKSAQKAHDDNLRHNLYVGGRTEGGVPFHHSYRSSYKN